jgi:sugar/nucleoside kinase (ribokinase family)
VKHFDVTAICNALVDITVKVDESDITKLQLTKGIMHLVDSERQSDVLANFADRDHAIELGGSALNAIRAIAGMGGKTAFAGMVGTDKFAKLLRSRLDELGVIAHLKETTDSTGTCAILVTPDGERTMNTCLGASRLFDESLVPESAIAAAKIFHFCGYQWDTDGQKRAIRAAIRHAELHKTTVSFDVADPFVVTRHKAELIDVIDRHADIVFANQEEARMLFDTTPEQAAQRIAKSGAIAVVKVGAKGAIIAHHNEVVHVPAVPTKVVDTTAAGDVFAGGFLYSLARNKPLFDCGRAATMLAGDVISRVGTTVDSKILHKASEL